MVDFRQNLLAVLSYGVGLVLATAGSPQTGVAQTLVVHVEGLRSSEGSVHLGFYDSEAQWRSEKSNFQRHRSKSGARAGRLTYTITDVAPGHYAVAIVDDENDNGGMDWGLLLPKEGFGFSNYKHRGISRPDFSDFDFDLRPGETTTVVISVRYL